MAELETTASVNTGGPGTVGLGHQHGFDHTNHTHDPLIPSQRHMAKVIDGDLWNCNSKQA